MSVTADVFHWLPVVAHALLNAAAPLNMFFMVVTLAVFKLEISRLNALAPMNIFSMEVTLDVSQREMSALNVVESIVAPEPLSSPFEKSFAMDVTLLVPQHGISTAPAPVPATPQSAPAAQQPTPEPAFARQFLTAVARSAWLANSGLGAAHLNGAGPGGVGPGGGG